MYERLLVPLDGSPFAEAALEPAFAIAEKFGSEVLLLRVVPAAETAIAAGHDAEFFALQKHWEENEVAESEAYLRRIRSERLRHGVPVRVQAVVGAPPSSIISAAEHFQASLIVMSTHGRSGLNRLMYG